MKRKFTYLFLGVVLLCVIFAVLLSFFGKVHSVFSANEKPDSALVKKGEYLARVSDCAACHTAINGGYYAGGLGVMSPFGAMYSTNITPDTKTGIGKFTLADFDKAVRHGVRPDGVTLYPAMPYPSFSRMKDDDIKALYAYFMLSVSPVENKNKAPDISWPFSMRWPVTVWRLTFAPKVVPYVAPVGSDPLVSRGEYIVTSLGHCGACHTPRGFGLQEEALDAKSVKFLSGGAAMDHWVPVSLRDDPTYGIGNMSKDEIVLLLKTGRSNHAAVLGGMADVVSWSTQYFIDDDLLAVASYLKSMPSVTPRAPQFSRDEQSMLQKDHYLTTAVAIYNDQCSICHLNNGTGIQRMFPPLANNPVVVASDPSSSINVILNGAALPPSRFSASAVAMPSFRNLSDQDIANVTNYIRNNWGNNVGKKITNKDVATIRQQTEPQQIKDTKTIQNGWSIISPQPMGGDWSFGADTHQGKDSPQ